MSYSWRPHSHIRPTALALAKQESRLLVFEVLDDSGKIKGWRPLGGGINFGETAEAAIQREIFEELKCTIEILGAPLVCENIYEHHAILGHEIIFAFPVHFHDKNIYRNTRFQVCEDNGSKHWVEWVDVSRFQTGKELLFPPTLVPQMLSLKF